MSGGRGERAAILWIAVLWAAATVFNLTKAVHIDDPTYLIIARGILADPLHPMSGSLVLSGSEIAIATTNQPPLLFYGYAGVMAVFGESALALHAFAALWTAAALAGFFALARALCPGVAPALTAALALGPVFLPAQNLMTDVPLLALWLPFFWLLIVRVPTTDSPGRAYVIAGCLAGAACLIKYTSLALLPLLVMAVAWNRHWRHLWTGLLPLGFLAAWSAFNVADYGEIHVLTRDSAAIAPVDVVRTGIEWLVTLGGVAPFSLLALPWLARRPRAAAGLAVGIGLACVGQRAWFGGFDPPAPALSTVFFANGALTLAVSLWAIAELRVRNAGAALLLAGWLAAGAGFIVLLAPFMAVRHVLLAVPALLLALGSALPLNHARRWAAGAAVACAALGVPLAVSDWLYADAYRQQARALRERFGEEAGIWYVGNWGWRWYAEAEGMRPYLPGRSRLRRGDVLLMPEIPTGPRQVAPADRRKVVRVDTATAPASWATRLRTMRAPPHGGYYGFAGPGLPWHWTAAPLDRIKIMRVR